MKELRCGPVLRHGEIEASIGVRQVTQAQCPAIKFLSQLGLNQARAPRINLAAVEVKNGDTLSGTIENFANRVVELLLVSEWLAEFELLLWSVSEPPIFRLI